MPAPEIMPCDTMRASWWSDRRCFLQLKSRPAKPLAIDHPKASQSKAVLAGVFSSIGLRRLSFEGDDLLYIRASTHGCTMCEC